MTPRTEGGPRLPSTPLDLGAVVLRSWRDDETDAAFLLAGWTDPEVARRSPVPNNPTREAARCWLRQAAERRPDPVAIDLVVADAITGAPLGEIGVSQLDIGKGTGVIGWWLIEAARGKGHATRAVDGFAAWLLEAGGLRRLAAVIDADNASSIAVAHRAGFRHGADLPDGGMVFERRSRSATVRSRP